MLAIGRACRGQDLRLKGHNRIGNMIVPNDNYCRFEEWFQPLLDEMLASQIDEVRASYSPTSGARVVSDVPLLPAFDASLLRAPPN